MEIPTVPGSNPGSPITTLINSFLIFLSMDYFDHLKELVNIERQYEIKQHVSEIKKLSGKKREEKGRAILNLTGKFLEIGLNNRFIFVFKRKKKIETEIKVGDIVLVSKEKVDLNNPLGTVIELGKKYIKVAFDKRPPKFLKGKNIRIDLYLNDITFKRQIEALEQAKKSQSRLKRVLLGQVEPQFSNVVVKEFKQDLNPSQKEAVRKALSAKDVFLIHGPPGTGKTTVCAEIIFHLHKKEKILVCADSNTAIDNIIDKLDSLGVKCLRIGHPARVDTKVIKYSLDHQVQGMKEYASLKAERERLYEEWNKVQAMLDPIKKWRRGLTDNQIIKLAQRNLGIRGIPRGTIKTMATIIKEKLVIDRKFDALRKREEKLIKKLINNANVICTTNSTAGSELLKDIKFDTVIIDEATQATEPSCWIAINKGKRLIMAGDHKQLPPTVLAAEELKETLFEKVINEKISAFLDTQYRMNEKICLFSNIYFYNSRLKTPDHIKDQTLNIKLRSIDTKKPVHFINIDGKEEQLKDSTSFINRKEAEKVVALVEEMLKAGVKDEQIGVISPYDDQVALLRKKLEHCDVEVHTVDGFQGREKDIIIVSFVRANKKGEIGFLRDYRRLNVALTRAKYLLILLGNEKTLKHDKLYAKLIKYAKEVMKG